MQDEHQLSNVFRCQISITQNFTLNIFKVKWVKYHKCKICKLVAGHLQAINALVPNSKKTSTYSAIVPNNNMHVN